MRTLSLRFVAALAALAACGGSDAPPAPPVAAPPPPAVQAKPLRDAHGIDVSHHSGEVAWDAVAADGYVFAYLKATEGVDDADPTFAEHWQALSDHEIRRGAYHFYVTEDDPEEQARFFLSRVDHRPGDLPPVVDVEVIGHGSTGDLVASLHRFLEILETEVGVTPIVYTNPGFWDTHFDASFSRYPLWIAEYGVDEPRVPQGWSSWTLWQYQGDATVPGVEKSADRSRAHPSVDLRTLVVPTPSGGSENG